MIVILSCRFIELSGPWTQVNIKGTGKISAVPDSLLDIYHQHRVDGSSEGCENAGADRSDIRRFFIADYKH